MRWPRIEKQDDWSIATWISQSPLDVSGVPAKPNLTRWQVTDVKAGFIADPFLFRQADRYHLFFEVLNRKTKKGEIGHAESLDGLAWRYSQIVLREEFHLSYPFVFEFEGVIYLMPECSESGVQHLYAADEFPFRWRKIAPPIESALVDASLVRHEGLWWMFAGIGSASDTTLNVFSASNPAGPWTPHPENPVRCRPERMCRPGGRPTVCDGRLLLFTQDCSRRYGYGLRACEVLQLDLAAYEERALSEDPLLVATGRGWNSHGTHHLDSLPLGGGTWLLATDGNHRSLLY